MLAESNDECCQPHQQLICIVSLVDWALHYDFEIVQAERKQNSKTRKEPSTARSAGGEWKKKLSSSPKCSQQLVKLKSSGE